SRFLFLPRSRQRPRASAMGVSRKPAQRAQAVLHQQKLTKAGQPAINSECCIATGRADGKPCLRACGEPGVPYCKAHMKYGDPSLKVATHPVAGKILVAARDLPKGYRLALWGRCTSDKKIGEKKMEWAFDLGSGWMLDPTGQKGSMAPAGPGSPRCGPRADGARGFRRRRRCVVGAVRHSDSSGGEATRLAYRPTKECSKNLLWFA
ncbi:unnamed protein product, partial [Prorocentrum cordatum]